MNFSEILIEMNTFSFSKIHLKMSYAKCRLFRLGRNVLNKIQALYFTVYKSVLYDTHFISTYILDELPGVIDYLQFYLWE